MNIGRSRELDLSSYDTDKIESGYLSIYDYFFAPLVKNPVALLELGIHKGGSLRLWSDYFPAGRIVGIDQKIPDIEFGPRVTVLEGQQDDTAVLDRAAALVGGQFDIIIDDASHMGAPTRASYSHLFRNHLKPGGIYVVEDWGTGYWSDWPDGENFADGLKGYSEEGGDPRRPYSHSFGTVGFVKDLVDEVGKCELSQGRSTNRAASINELSSLCVFPGLAIARKTTHPHAFSLSLVDGRP